MMLRKLAPSVIIDVDTSNAVTIKGSGTIFAFKLMFGLCFNYGGGLFFREREDVGVIDGPAP